LIQILARYGYYDLHGAGLTNGRNDYLLLGPSGSGKSNLSLNLVRKGWGYASDDALVINGNESDISVLSFRKQFYIDSVLTEHFPELNCEIQNHGQIKSEKYFIDLEKVWPGRFQQQLVPDKVVFCRVSNGENSKIRPISKKDALLRLLPQSVSVFFNQAFAKKQIDVLKRLIQQTNCYQLDAGLDVYNDAQKAASILSGG